LPLFEPSANRLLAALPAGDRERLAARADRVSLEFGDTLARTGAASPYVHFPTDSFISMITEVAGRSGLEMGIVGDEGMLGAWLVLDVSESPFHALVQGAGGALRMEVPALREELERSPALARMLQRYLYVTLCQLGQSGACTRFHRLEARLARWLLMTQDRAHADAFAITHEFLAAMLGVRRAGVTVAASGLQRRGVIRYRRGHLTVLDRAALEAAACECYLSEQVTRARILG